MTAGLIESTEPLAAELGRSRNLNELAGAIHGWLAPVLGNVASLIAVNRPHEASISVLPAGTIHGETVARYSKIALAAPHPVSWVIRTGQPLFLADLLAHLREFSLIEADFRSNGFEATGTVPLVGSSGENIGSLSLIWSERREFDADLKAEIATLASLATSSLESILGAEAEHKLAEDLQRTLLRLDRLPLSAAVAAAYHSPRGLLGGDWYDALSLDDGTVGLTVGDVVGSGLESAVAMGQLRAAAAAAALVDSRPVKVIEALDRMAVRSPGAGYATTIFGVLDVHGGEFQYANAGHVPPALVDPEGNVRFLNSGRRWPLGLQQPKSKRTRPKRPARSRIAPGSLLVLYTDGLIERRGESLALGLHRLAELLAQIWWLPTSLICERLVSQLVGSERESDDVAVLAVRTVGAPQRVFVDIVPGVVENVAPVRHRLGAWLSAHEVDETESETFTLAMSEAIGNAVLHGSNNDPDHPITVEVSLDSDSIIGCVRDRGSWTEHLSADEKPRGLGLRLMRGLVNEFDLRSTSEMTRVVMRFDRRTRLSA